MFLETLVDFVMLHRDDLQDWLFVLLTQLLKKMGADLLGSVQGKVQKALDVTRSAPGLKSKRISVFIFFAVKTRVSCFSAGSPSRTSSSSTS